MAKPEIGRLLLLAFLAWTPLSLAQVPGPQATAYLFWAEGCPHCEHAINYLQRLEAEEPRFGLRMFEVTRNAGNRALFRKAIESFGIADPAVPLTVIGDRVWVGYLNDAQTGVEMRARATACLAMSCPDSVAGLAGAEPSAPAARPGRVMGALPETLHLPLIGEVAVKELSLPAIAVLLGALDGFNPCAMWTLVFLIGLLVGMKDTVRMWILGAAFILGSAAVYFVFMAAWLNLLLFLGSVGLIRVVIGLLALGGGAYYLRQYVLNKEEACAVTAPARRQRVFQRLKTLTQESRFLIAFFGILALAFLVNLVELVCSAGIPVVFTQILTMSALSAWQYHGYLLLYILVFMADDLLVFVTAMTTLRVTGLTTKYSRYSHLLGAVVLAVIGALMLLRPEWLMFG